MDGACVGVVGVEGADAGVEGVCVCFVAVLKNGGFAA